MVALIAVAVALAFCGRCSTRCNVLSLHCLGCLSLCFLLHFSPSASSAPSRVSPTQLPLRTCSAACLAARQVLRRLLALRMCGALSTRIHHALCHHVMCLFDTWHSSCTEFAFSCCRPWASTSLALTSLSLFLSSSASCALLSSRASSALFSSRASNALFASSCFLSCSLSSFCSKHGGFSLVSSSCPISCAVSFSVSCCLSSSCFRRSHSQPISSFWSLSFLGPTWPGGVSHQPPR